jgi:hypothetical protein
MRPHKGCRSRSRTNAPPGRREAEAEHGRRAGPRPPEWVVEVGIGTGKPAVQVLTGNCHMIGSRRRPVSRDEARRLLADGLRACTHCQPDTQLHIIDLDRVLCSEANESLVAAQGRGESKEGQVVAGVMLVARAESAVARQPGHGPSATNRCEQGKTKTRHSTGSQQISTN